MNISQIFWQQLKLGSSMENQHQKLSVPLVVIGFLIILVLVVEAEVLGHFSKRILWLLKSLVVNINHLEYSEWKVTSGSRRVNLIIMYRPPYSAAHPVTSAVFFVEFAEYLESIVLSADPLLIVGDFNIHIDSNENYDAIKLSELLQSFSLTQHVQVPTHSSGHILDLIITRKTDDLVSSVPRAGCLFSDHMTLESVINRHAPLRTKTIVA